MLAIGAFVLFVIAAILEFINKEPHIALALGFVGLACIALHMLAVAGWAYTYRRV